jgi:hypothetical protein
LGVKAKIAVTCLSTSESDRLQTDVQNGVVDLVLQQFSDAAEYAIDELASDAE